MAAAAAAIIPGACSVRRPEPPASLSALAAPSFYSVVLAPRSRGSGGAVAVSRRRLVCRASVAPPSPSAVHPVEAEGERVSDTYRRQGLVLAAAATASAASGRSSPSLLSYSNFPAF